MERLMAILTADRRDFALDTRVIQSMILMPETVVLRAGTASSSRSYVRGVINVGGEIIPVVDLRLRLGFPSRQSEVDDFLKLINNREEDHRKWLAELELSVVEKREFKLQRDPHQCAFGKWYDHYRSDNPVVSQILRGFDAPHKRIHALAGEVEAFVKGNDLASANSLIAGCREDEFKSLINLFERLRNAYRKITREVAVIVKEGTRSYAVTVDKIRTVTPLNEEVFKRTDELNILLPEKYPVSGIGKEDNTERMILFLDPTALLPDRDEA